MNLYALIAFLNVISHNMKNRYFFKQAWYCFLYHPAYQFVSTVGTKFLWARQGSSKGFEYRNAIIADDSGQRMFQDK